MDAKKLRDWVDKQNIRNRALEAFWLNLNTYRVEEPEQFDDYFGITIKMI